jgi:hypothetical protein
VRHSPGAVGGGQVVTWGEPLLGAEGGVLRFPALDPKKGHYGEGWTGMMGVSLLSIIPMLLVFVCFRRYFVQGIAGSGMKYLYETEREDPDQDRLYRRR